MAILAKKQKRQEGKSDRWGGGGCNNPLLQREKEKVNKIAKAVKKR